MLLGYQYLQSKQTASDTVEQLRALFSDNQLTLDSSVDVMQKGLSPMRLTRNTTAAFARSFCETFSYKDIAIHTSGNTTTVTGTQYIAGVPIRYCGITMTFQGGYLIAVSGSHISLENGQLEDSDQLTCASALVRFLDYRSSAGIICSRITAVSCIYSLQGTSSSLRLAPLWLVETDTYNYLIDASSGEISRA